MVACEFCVLQLPRKTQYQFGLKDIKNLAEVATAKLRDERFIEELRGIDIL